MDRNLDIKMDRKEFTKRIVACAFGMVLQGIGIAFIKHSGLGITPIASIGNVFSLKFDQLSVGTWVFLWNVVMVLLQILILRRDFKKLQLLQIPLSRPFAIFTDMGLAIAGRFPVETYMHRMVCVLLGIVLMALGITLAVAANIILNAGEGLVKALTEKIKIQFGTMKIIFDCCCVGTSALISLGFFGTVLEIREGTLISAILTGILVKAFISQLKEELDRIFSSP